MTTKLTKAQEKKLGGAIKSAIDAHMIDPSLHGSLLKRISPVLADELVREREKIMDRFQELYDEEVSDIDKAEEVNGYAHAIAIIKELENKHE